MNHDGRRKARLVTGGHFIGTLLDSVYSGVVSLQRLRLVLFLAELNNLKIWATDVGNAYLEAKMQEKVYIIAGPKFGSQQGHTLVVNKALYGLKLSGKMWGERCGDILEKIGFKLFRTQDATWMRDKGDHYKYKAQYVDDWAIASWDPQSIISTLENKHNLKLKGSAQLDTT